MQVLILRPFRKDNIYFRTIEERDKINSVDSLGNFKPVCLVNVGIVFLFYSMYVFVSSKPVVFVLFSETHTHTHTHTHTQKKQHFFSHLHHTCRIA